MLEKERKQEWLLTETVATDQQVVLVHDRKVFKPKLAKILRRQCHSYKKISSENVLHMTPKFFMKSRNDIQLSQIKLLEGDNSPKLTLKYLRCSDKDSFP